ncbi:MAG: antibiotic biosynthesis monooxygenase [Verrucomicrobiales bacterium]|nr:antibiotic biosynthesis monooxygenase [Verrucomicrobiales bacterium]
MMTSLIVTVEVNPDRVEDFLRFMTEAAEDARTKEPGCRRFEVARLTDRPNVFTLAELYDNFAALEAHRQTPHFQLFAQRAKEHDLIVNKTSALGEVVSA